MYIRKYIYMRIYICICVCECIFIHIHKLDERLLHMCHALWNIDIYVCFILRVNLNSESLSLTQLLACSPPFLPPFLSLALSLSLSHSLTLLFLSFCLFLLCLCSISLPLSFFYSLSLFLWIRICLVLSCAQILAWVGRCVDVLMYSMLRDYTQMCWCVVCCETLLRCVAKCLALVCSWIVRGLFVLPVTFHHVRVCVPVRVCVCVVVNVYHVCDAYVRW